MTNGTIEVDVLMHGIRSFMGVMFRAQENGNFELFYLRPHKDGLPDAIQYTPNLNRQSLWQLYTHDATAAVPLQRDRWVPIKITFAARKAAIYVDGQSSPALEVDLKGDGGNGGSVTASASSISALSCGSSNSSHHGVLAKFAPSCTGWM